MSQAHHGEPLRWHWLYIPLVAYLVFAVGPSVLAPIFFILSLFVDISSIIGPAQHAPRRKSSAAVKNVARGSLLQ